VDVDSGTDMVARTSSEFFTRDEKKKKKGQQNWTVGDYLGANG
jgi:hypothetical protein